MKIFNLILALLFFTFAYLQLNDAPGDVMFWFLIYSYTGVICAFAAWNKYNMWTIILGIVVLLYQMFRMFPAFSQWISAGTPSIVGEMKASSPFIELVREFLGLVVCMVVLVYQYIRYTKLKKAREE
ncbi:MAG TPA: transmembrane 220 family protein [Saprospiraceae bacterium]|nr:transmembrane 220 family protein [Saprospiraceae bacterium]